ANWKMNGTLASIRPLLKGILAGLGSGEWGTDVAICTPYIYIPELQTQLRDTGVALGAQNVSEHQAGAYTGEIAAAMLRDYDCHYVIVGHSERRHLYGETSLQVAKKFTAAVSHGLAPVLCIGEQLQEREDGDTEEVVAEQLDAVIDTAGIEAFAGAVIAYEPVWAIGTGRNATPEQAQDVHAFIRLRLARHDDGIAAKIRILYGGSVKPDNAAAIFSMADIDGGLIGGASLNADDFLAICHATG
ncbi:MAG: triose-phosphate isomerase, partial [Gammaproteobacteria bacterium]